VCFAELLGEHHNGEVIYGTPGIYFKTSLGRSMRNVLFLFQTSRINLVNQLSRVNRLDPHEFPDFSTWFLAPNGSLGFYKQRFGSIGFYETP
jgi:hypothetical protein